MQTDTSSKDRRAKEVDRLRPLLRQLPGFFWFADADGSMEYVSDDLLQFLGVGMETLAGSGWTAIVHPKDLESALKASTPSDTGRSDTTCRVRRADGSYRWLRTLAQPVLDGEGRVAQVFGLVVDVDDQKRAEALLAGEKRLLEMVASGSPLPDVLEALCRLVEATASPCHCSILLIDPSGRFHPGGGPTLPPGYNEAVDGVPVQCDAGPCGTAASLKTQVIVPDLASEPRWVGAGWRKLALAEGLKACWSTPILSLAGKVLGTFALYQREQGSPTPLQQDLIAQFTHIASIAIERAQVEATLKRSEAFLAEGQRLSSSGSFSWRVATDEMTWSEQAYRIFEIGPATPVTFELIDTRIHPEDVPAFHERVERARRDGDDFEFEYRLQMPDRSVKYLHVVAHATRGQHDQLEYIGAVQDVTERRLSEDALGKVRSELAHMARVTTLGALTASIAHEVNQPLSGIITNASTGLRMLAADPPNIDGARETARRTIRDANRASDVIARLRALFGKKGTATESVDLSEATREVLALSSSELQRGRVSVRAELADDLPPVTGDRVQLQQVVLNLLLNASEAMSDIEDRPRQLLVSTERDGGDHVRLTVQDSGIGVDPHDLERLFEAFYTTKNGGMGIGLSVSRSIIESHHGRLWAAPNDGPGATFCFSVPRASQLGTANPGTGGPSGAAATDLEPVVRNS
jgi:PAS domain S-box-containing protein